MSMQSDIELVDRLLSDGRETELFECKKNNVDPCLIAKIVCGLSNSARRHDADFAYIIWGIDESTYNVVGTTFDPDTFKKSNQKFDIWLSKNIIPSLDLKFKCVNHPDGKVVLLQVPPPLLMPASFCNISYIRIGSSNTKLSDHPDIYQALSIKLQQHRWEENVAKQNCSQSEILDLLDYSAYFRLLGQQIPKNNDDIVQKLRSDRLIQEEAGGMWKIHNLGAILLAKNLGDFSSGIERKGVRFICYDGTERANLATHRLNETRGYAICFAELISKICDLIPTNERIEPAIRESRKFVPDKVVREIVANALVHQDMNITGTGPIIELFTDRIEVTNPGFPLIESMRIIDYPPRSRNELVASLMRRMKMCEEAGVGMELIFGEMESNQQPSPQIFVTEYSTKIVIHGPRTYRRMTMEERILACYWHAALKRKSGNVMKNSTLCTRLGIKRKNAAMATGIIKRTMEMGLIKMVEEGQPKSGYVPFWA